MPDALPHTVALLRTAQLPAPAIVLQALLVDLSALTEPLILVLDDYHFVTAEAIHHTVSYLLRHLPDPCRLVVLSRTDPPLPLVRLRAEQQVTEVRVAQLRFTAPEAEVLVATLQGAAPDPAYVAELFQQTEGWVIALQLAALVPRDDTKRGGVQHAKHQIAEYLGEEVFAQQPGELQKVLLALAIPERFCAGLCAALLAQSANLLYTEYMLEQMTRANLLITPLEGDGDWYRFHPLFRDLLLRRLRLTVDAAQVRVLQLRAALWLETARLYVEALRLYLAAGAEDAAGALVERLLQRELGRDISNAPPAYWLRQLPADLIERRPGLALIQARIDGFHMDGKANLASLERVDALLAAPVAAEQPLPWPTFRGDLAVLRGTAIQYWQGDWAAAIDVLWQGLHMGTVPALTATGLAFLGDLTAALAAAEQITLDTHLFSRGWYAIAPPQLIRASALIASLDPANFAQAELLITTLLAEAERTYNMRPVVCALAMYAQLRQAQGQPAAALAFLERAIRLAAPLGLIRTLLDCGPTLQPLLVGLAAQGVAPAYVQGLLSFYATAPLAQARPTIAPVALTVPKLLTRREAEILKLLAERWSDKEIAKRLVVTPNTVRKHTSTIYSKLGVNSRREAVAVARSLGLIRH